MIRILIADDHAMVRWGLSQIIATTTDMQVAAEATKGDEISKILREFAIDLLLLDISMPGTCGPELIRQIHDDFPSLPILVVSMHNEGQMVVRALRAGASGYVTKDSEPEILLTAIRNVMLGKRYIDPALMDIMLTEVSHSEGKTKEALSNREFQVLQMIKAGYSLKEIAAQLSLSSKTVSTHKARIMEKLKISNNADLIRLSVKPPVNPR